MAKWAYPVLARVMLRRELGCEPAQGQVDSRVEEIADESVKVPSSDAVIAALERGEEVRWFHHSILAFMPPDRLTSLKELYPWRLECVDYEESLQWEIAVTFPHYKE